MSDFDSNPFADPGLNNPFKDPSVTQVTRNVPPGLDEYNPFSDSRTHEEFQNCFVQTTSYKCQVTEGWIELLNLRGERSDLTSAALKPPEKPVYMHLLCLLLSQFLGCSGMNCIRCSSKLKELPGKCQIHRFLSKLSQQFLFLEILCQ